ncbi:MAG: hypothetical protein HQ481_02370, partial [Alphaproteobacteria bacterium]|nr:hypothetical protein [Alphaproteobacteria bacterium]
MNGAHGKSGLTMVAFVFVSINLMVDLLYFTVDPRLKVDKGAAVGRLS